jgi:hypothetical protein
MIRTSGEFLDEAATTKGTSVLSKQASLVRERLRTGMGQLKAQPGELAALFFVDIQGTTPRLFAGGGHGTRTNIGPLLANPVWSEALDAPDIGPVLRKLLVRWVEAKVARADNAGQQFAALVRTKPFPEAAAPLIRFATDKKADVLSVRVLAIEALGKVGGTEAKKTLTGLISDTTNVFGAGEDEHRLGDAALAALVQMSGKRLADFGLDSNTGIGFANSEEDESIHLSLYGFRTSDARTKAIQKWKDEAAKADQPAKGKEK